MHIGALLLAAGFSNRFGGIKLLARLNNGSTVFAQTLNRLSAAVEEVVIITRPDLVSALEADESQIRPFDHADQGMGASLAFGMKFTKHWDACIVCLSDMPFVRTATYSLLINSADLFTNLQCFTDLSHTLHESMPHAGKRHKTIRPYPRIT